MWILEFKMEPWEEYIEKLEVIYVNNRVFGSQLENAIKSMLKFALRKGDPCQVNSKLATLFDPVVNALVYVDLAIARYKVKPPEEGTIVYDFVVGDKHFEVEVYHKDLEAHREALIDYINSSLEIGKAILNDYNDQEISRP